MAFAGIAPPDPFLPTPGRPVQPWPRWHDMFKVYLLASGASEFSPERRKALLLHSLGPEGQRIFNTLSVSQAAEKTEEEGTGATPDVYDSAVAALAKHFDTTCNLVVERHRFHRRIQFPGESIPEYVTALQERAAMCSFTSQEESLRDQFVAGVSSHRIRERLLLEGSSLSFHKAVALASQIEQAAVEMKEFSISVQPVSAQSGTKGSSSLQSPNSLPRARTFSQRESGNRPPSRQRSPSNSQQHAISSHCFRCGSKQHRASWKRCPAKGKKCFFCGRIGHFENVCNQKRSQAAVREVSVDSPLQDETVEVLVVQQPLASGIHIIIQVGQVAMKLLVDSGSSVSILSGKEFDQHFSGVPLLPVPRVTLLDYSKRPILVRGCFFSEVFFENRSAPLLFYVVEQGTSLIGLDGIKALKLRIEGSELQCFQTSTVPNAEVARTYPIEPSMQLPSALQRQFCSLFTNELGLAKGFVHRIKTRAGVQPVASKLRRLPFMLRPRVSSELQRLESLDIIERIDASEWVSPIVVIQKKDGSIRLCVDLREPNKAIVPDSFPLPHMDELLHALVGATHFSKLDLASAYHQVPLHPESRDLTAFITHEGLYRFKRVCFGLASAPAAFQSMMSRILRNCPGVLFYIDDVIIFGKSAEEHLKNLEAVLQRIKDAGLKLNSKCVFGVQELEFLGHKVTPCGISPLPGKVDAIVETPVPRNAAELRSFLGLVEYYAKFVPHLAEMVEPMRALLRKGETVTWSVEVDNSFRAVKAVLSSDLVLHMFDPALPIIISTDASECGLGAVLQQHAGNKLRTVAFASRTLSPAERKYAVGEKEALACIWACEHWHAYLWGRSFTLRTDHQALVSLLSSQGSGRRPLRIARWCTRLLRYNFTVEYQKGSSNTVADALSRLPVHMADGELTFEEEIVSMVQPTCLTKEQFEQAVLADATLQKVKAFVNGSWPSHRDLPEGLEPYFRVRDELSVVSELLLRAERLVVPSSLVAQLVATAHETHQGIGRTKARLREQFWWPRMDVHVEEAVHNCSICQAADKSAKTSPAPLQPVELPERPWQKLAIDIVGPLERAPPDCRFVLTLVDYFSKWPEVQFSREISTRTVTEFLLNVFAREGYPEEIVCDNGPQFTSKEFVNFLQERVIRLSHSSVYYPQANGQIERFNRTFKTYLQLARLEQRPLRTAVRDYLAAYRCTPHATTGVAPAVLLHGRLPRTKLDIFGLSPESFAKAPYQELARLRQRVKRRQEYSKAYTDRRRAAKPTTVAVGDMVRVKKPSVSFKGDISFSKPRKVIEKCGPASFILDDGKTWNAAKLCKVPARRPGDNGLQHHSAGRESSLNHDPVDATLLSATWQPVSAEASVPAAKPVPSADCDSRSPTRSAAGQFPASETVSRPPVNTTEEPVVSCPPGRRIQPHRDRRRPDRYGY